MNLDGQTISHPAVGPFYVGYSVADGKRDADRFNQAEVGARKKRPNQFSGITHYHLFSGNLTQPGRRANYPLPVVLK